MSTDAISVVSPAPDYDRRLDGVSLATSPHKLSQLPPAQQAREVSRQFEAILVRQLLNESVGKSLMGSDGAQSDIYGYMMTDILADRLTQGSGLGLGTMLAHQLTPRTATQTSTSTKALP